jgi:uncharacterized protein (AIM24 family)
MAVPEVLVTQTTDEVVGGVRYHIEGELVPSLTVEVADVPVYFEHHILLWKDPSIQIGLKSLKGAFKRMLAGMPIIMTETQGQGRIAFSRDACGHIFAIHLKYGETVEVREHQFLAATNQLEYSFRWLKGVSNILFGGTGLFIDTFTCKEGEGAVWLYGYGNVFQIELGPGETIDIEPSAWVYKDPGVQMNTIFQGLKAGLFGSAGRMFWNRFTGPGRIGLQSMSISVGSQQSGSSTASGNPLVALVGVVIKLLGG